MAYTNVKVTVGQVLRLTKSVSYDPATNQLTISTITVAGKTYNNVLITVGEVLSYNTGTPEATISYDPATNILTIPRIAVDGVGGSLVPMQIGTGFIDIAAGENVTLAVKSDGSLWAQGDNSYGQLGDGTTMRNF